MQGARFSVQGFLHSVGSRAAWVGMLAFVVGSTAAAAQEPFPRSDFSGLTAGASFAALDTAPAIDCMTAAIAYEAGNQSIEGQEAVGQVILNRMHHPRFPKSVCGVVFAGAERRTGCQFTFTCDGSLRRRLSVQRISMARSIAISVLTGAVPDRVSGATHYHADYVLPYWASSGVRVGKIGAHVFYRMPGEGGKGVPGEGMTEDEVIASNLARLAVRTAQPVSPRQMTRAVARPLFAPWGLPSVTVASR